MRSTATIRRAAAALLTTAVAGAGLVGTGGSAQAAQTGHHPRGGAKVAPGFTPVRTTAGEVLGMTAPAAGELWVAEKDADGKLVLEHKSGRRWTTTRPGLDAGWSAQISGTAANDVWLAAGGRLSHWDGRVWRDIAAPGPVVSVTDVSGSEAYVGVEAGADRARTGVYRVRAKRATTTWTALGRPADEETDTWATWTPQEIRVVRGAVFTAFRKRPHSATNIVRGFSYTDGRWNDLAVQTFTGGGSYETGSSWLTPNPALELVLGRFDHGSSQGGLCQVWVRGSGVSACTTRWAVGASALLKDGRVVVGGNDFRPKYSAPVTPGAFGLRDARGRESLIDGDPGDATVAMAVEPRTDVAWAATTTNGVTTLQSYQG